MKFKGIRNSAEVGALASYLWNTSSIPKLNNGKNLRIKSICLPVRLICLAINSTVALPRNTSLGVIDSLFPVTTLFSLDQHQGKSTTFSFIFYRYFFWQSKLFPYVSFKLNERMDRPCPKIYFNLTVKFLKGIVSIRVSLRILDLNLHFPRS